MSHTSKVFDTGNLAVLKSVENKFEFTEKMMKSMPSLKSFLSKGLIPAVIEVIGKLISNDGHRSSIYEEFDDVLNKTGKSKKHCTKKDGLLRYCVAAILHHFNDFKNTLSDTGSNNQLAQACELYLEVEHIKVALFDTMFNTLEVKEPISQLELYILERFCQESAVDL